MRNRCQHPGHRRRDRDVGRKVRDRAPRLGRVLVGAEDEPRHHLDPLALNGGYGRPDVHLRVLLLVHPVERRWIGILDAEKYLDALAA